MRIHRDDNVLIMVAPIRPGDRELIDGREAVFTQNIAIGHKVASRDIKIGDKVYKCGVPITEANADVTGSLRGCQASARTAVL